MDKNYEKLSKKAINLMLLSEILASVFLTAVWCIIYLFVLDEEVKTAHYIAIAVLVVIWCIAIAAPFVRYRRYRYLFSEDEIRMREGFLWVSEQIVPIERLQKISMETGPFDRIFGLTKVFVTTAGGDVKIRFLEKDKAENIVTTLKNRINTMAVKQRAEADKIL